MRRNVSAWTGLALLAFNLIAGALLPAQAASPANQLAQQAYICTALGLTAIGPDGANEPGQSSHDISLLCVYCLPLLSGGYDGPAAQATLEAPLSSVALADYDGRDPASISPQQRHNSAAPRAPPAL